MVAIDLTRFEQGAPFAGDEQAALAALAGAARAPAGRADRAPQARADHVRRLERGRQEGRAQAARRGVGPVPRRDPLRRRQRRRRRRRHWLAPFWSALPPAGDTTIFYRSWYRRLIEDRAAGLIEGKRWSRACDEINEFEAQQRDHGTLIVKLFFHVSADEQLKRLRERQADPWRRHWSRTAPPTPRRARAHDRRAPRPVRADRHALGAVAGDRRQ